MGPSSSPTFIEEQGTEGWVRGQGHHESAFTLEKEDRCTAMGSGTSVDGGDGWEWMCAFDLSVVVNSSLVGGPRTRLLFQITWK